MNTSNATECKQTGLVYLLQQLADDFAEVFHGAIRRIRKSRERAQMYRVYRRLDAKKLRDIGLDDPQKQLDLLGRYL